MELTHTHTHSSCCFHRRELPIVSLQAYYLCVLLLLTKEVDIWLLIADWLYGEGKSICIKQCLIQQQLLSQRRDDI